MKKKTKAAVAGLATVALVGGTFAIWQATTTINNPFSTNAYSADTVEKFNPADGNDWEPGATVDKQVGAVNTGDYDVYVRMKMNEEWSRNNEKPFKEISAIDQPAQTGADAKNKITNVWQANPTDGQTAADDTVVHKNGLDESSWIYNSADGYYYYYKALKPGAHTDDNLIDSVTLDSSVDMGQYAEKDTVYWIASGDNAALSVNEVLNNSSYASNFKTYTAINTEVNFASLTLKNETPVLVAGNEKATIENYVTYLKEQNPETNYSVFTKDGRQLDKDKKGYADADYELTITAEFSQVTGCPWNIPESITGGTTTTTTTTTE